MDGVPQQRMSAEGGYAGSVDPVLIEPVTAAEREAAAARHGLILQRALAEIATDLGIDTISEATRVAPPPSAN